MSLTEFQRLDKFLEDKGLAPTRERAADLIKAGKVTVNGVVITSPNCPVTASQKIIVSNLDTPWITKDSIKLDAALKHFKIDVKGRVCVDLGAGKGGFTDVLLQNKAKHIFSVDKETNLLHSSLRLNERVTNVDRVEISQLTPQHITIPFDFVVCDIDTPVKSALVNFISLCAPQTEMIIILKPAIECADNDQLKKHCARDIEMWLKLDTKCSVSRSAPCPLPESETEPEFLIHFKKL